MREILFRGKVESGEWVYGHYHEALRSLQKNSFIISLGKTHKVDPDTVGQFTGKTDLNARKTFEGDIFLDQNGDKWVISWSDANSAFFAGKHGKEYQESKRFLDSLEICEIIGNIHEQR